MRITLTATPSFDADVVVFLEMRSHPALAARHVRVAKESVPVLVRTAFVAGLLRLKGNHDPTPELEEMKREKEEADREARVSVLSLVRIVTEKKKKSRIRHLNV